MPSVLERARTLLCTSSRWTGWWTWSTMVGTLVIAMPWLTKAMPCFRGRRIPAWRGSTGAATTRSVASSSAHCRTQPQLRLSSTTTSRTSTCGRASQSRATQQGASDPAHRFRLCATRVRCATPRCRSATSSRRPVSKTRVGGLCFSGRSTTRLGGVRPTTSASSRWTCVGREPTRRQRLNMPRSCEATGNGIAQPNWPSRRPSMVRRLHENWNVSA
mmetsp:Transcript_443/g.1240  ORF Transcript_443/g.1240 Transcript_443/m.1240 type:complete len:217 (-) Transcript_443:784-1434(-)